MTPVIQGAPARSERLRAVAIVLAERAPESEPGFFPGAPDLAVEVASPSDRVQDVDEKAQAWLAAGSQMVWVVWPNTRTVSVHRPNRKPTTLREDDTLDGADVVRSFRCPVRDVFE